MNLKSMPGLDGKMGCAFLRRVTLPVGGATPLYFRKRKWP
jgi:Mg2+ and Co2+ transporter CorA